MQAVVPHCYVDTKGSQHPDHPSRSWVLDTCSFLDYSILQVCCTSKTCIATIQCWTADSQTFSITIPIMQSQITQRLVIGMCVLHFSTFLHDIFVFDICYTSFALFYSNICTHTRNTIFLHALQAHYSKWLPCKSKSQIELADPFNKLSWNNWILPQPLLW